MPKPGSKADPKQSRRAERLARIVERLLENHEVSTKELRETGIPERTARADLFEISQLRLERVRGGLAISDRFHARQLVKNIPMKTDIADEAAALFSPNASVAASAGSTVPLVIAAMETHKIAPVIITNTLAVSDLCQHVSFLHLVGGQYDPEIHALVGPDAVAGFCSESRSYLQGLVGISGITVQDGQDAFLYVRHLSEVSVLQAMLERVVHDIVLVADASKLGRPDTWKFSSVKMLATKERRVHLVTNLPDQWKAELGEHFQNAKKAHDALKALEHTVPRFELRSVQRHSSGKNRGPGEEEKHGTR